MGLFDKARHDVASESDEPEDGLSVLANLAEEQRARDNPVFDQEQPDDAQPEQVDISVAEDNDDRPAWLPERFATPEALAESYKHASRTLTQAQQQNHELVGQVDALASMLEAQTNLRPLALNEQLTPAERSAVMSQRVEQIYEHFRPLPPVGSEQWNEEVAHGIQQLVPDWDEDTAAKVNEMIEHDPNALPPYAQGSPQGMALAVAQLGGVIRHREWTEQMRHEQQRNKSQAQTLSGQTGRPAPTDAWEDRWDEITNAGNNKFGDIVR